MWAISENNDFGISVSGQIAVTIVVLGLTAS